MLRSATLLAGQRIVPVVEIDSADDAIPLAEALIAGGIGVIEVTLRTRAALEAIERIVDAALPICVGAGSIAEPGQFERVKSAGAMFGVSPGLTPALEHAALAAQLPLVPGVATVSEAIAAHAFGVDVMKFFPAGPAGGVEWLHAVAGPLPDYRFVPTGGVNATNFRDYLACPNVIAVGGSWVAPRGAIAAREWAGITARARAASSG